MHEDEASENVKEKSESRFFVFSFVHIVKCGGIFGEVRKCLRSVSMFKKD